MDVVKNIIWQQLVSMCVFVSTMFILPLRQSRLMLMLSALIPSNKHIPTKQRSFPNVYEANKNTF